VELRPRHPSPYGRGCPLQNHLIPENFPELNDSVIKGKETRDIAAEKSGFGNARTYQQAKAVVEQGVGSLPSRLRADIATLPDARAVVVDYQHLPTFRRD
jgi:hypothetical protein